MNFVMLVPIAKDVIYTMKILTTYISITRMDILVAIVEVKVSIANTIKK